MKLELTSNCNDVLNHARIIAYEFSHAYVTTEHVFISLLDRSKTVKEILNSIKIPIQDIRKIIIKDIALKSVKGKSKTKPNFSPKISRLVTLAGITAKKHNSPVIGTQHLLLGLLEEDIGLVTSILEQNGIDISEIQKAVWDTIDPNYEEEPQLDPEMELAGKNLLVRNDHKY